MKRRWAVIIIFVATLLLSAMPLKGLKRPQIEALAEDRPVFQEPAVTMCLAELYEVTGVPKKPREVVIDGDRLDPDVERYLEEVLEDAGISWWWPYAISQMHQESSFHSDQVTNGIDVGIFQYRSWYWEEWVQRAGFKEKDIWNPYDQIDVNISMVRQWLNAGCSIEEAISNHNTGGYGGYSQEYVDDVMRWFPQASALYNK